MNRLFYDNGRLLVLAIALIAVSGLSSLFVLPRMEDPVLTQRAAIVNTVLAGAKPERVEALVTEPIEEELQEIPEVKELRSTSRSGISSIVIELRDDVYGFHADEVWSRIRDKIEDARPLLPAEASKPDFDLLEVTAYASIVAVAWQGEGEANYAVLRRLAEELEERLRKVKGTREVDTFGDPAEEVTIEIDRARLATLGLTPTDVARQLAASDAKAAAGLVRASEGSLLIEVDSELDTAQRIASTPIRYAPSNADDSGRIVTLGAVADVRKGIADPPRRLAYASGKPAVALGCLVRGEKRVDLWHADARKVIDRFAAELPPAVSLETIFEQSGYVESRLAELAMNLLIGAAGVMLVIWVMMGWRSAIVVGSALPLASLMVLAGMRWLGIPIHQMSVTGLIIALGLLIDNAIVIVDEVADRIRDGASPGDAVARSVSHLAAPLAGSTLTTALSFAPIALMPGPAGEFVGAIAISVILAIASSFLLAMTLTPAIAAMLLPRGGGSTAWWSAGFSSRWLTEWWRSVLAFVFRKPALGILVSIAPPLAGFFLATTLTEQFFPPAERDQFQIQVDLPANASMAATQRLVAEAREVILEHPRVTGTDWFLGESAPSFYYNMLANRAGVPQFAQALVQIDAVEGYREVIHELQATLDARLPSARFIVRQLEQGPPFDAPIEIRLFGPDLETLRELGLRVRRVLAETPNIVHSQSELSEVLPKLKLSVDEAEARLAGLEHADIARQLDTMLEGAVGGSVLEETENLPVRVRVGGDERSELSRIGSADLVGSSADGGASRLPLTALANMSLTPEISAIQRFNNERMNEIRAYTTAGELAAEVQSDFQHRLEADGFELPPGYRIEYAGEGSKRDDAVGNLMSSVAVLMTLMVATLVLSFRSFRMAAIIGVVAGLSIGLSVGALSLAGYPFGFTAIIGAMGLVGVAINDTIVVLAAIREEPSSKEGNPDAVRDVVVKSSRHVFATTLTTIAGFMPLILGGGGFWPPMAVTIAGGVGGATLLALIFAPSSYILAMCQGCRAEEDDKTEHATDDETLLDSPAAKPLTSYPKEVVAAG